MTEIPGVVNDVAPLTRATPPTAEAYQSTVSLAPTVDEIVTVPVPHRELPIPEGVFGRELTVSIAEHELWHPFALVMVTVYDPGTNRTC
jgi:hypothetical protein